MGWPQRQVRFINTWFNVWQWPHYDSLIDNKASMWFVMLHSKHFVHTGSFSNSNFNFIFHQPKTLGVMCWNIINDSKFELMASHDPFETYTIFSFKLVRLIKPQTFADCVGNELPIGWEEAYDPQVGPFFANHISRNYLKVFKEMTMIADIWLYFY